MYISLYTSLFILLYTRAHFKRDILILWYLFLFSSLVALHFEILYTFGFFILRFGRLGFCVWRGVAWMAAWQAGALRAQAWWARGFGKPLTACPFYACSGYSFWRCPPFYSLACHPTCFTRSVLTVLVVIRDGIFAPTAASPGRVRALGSTIFYCAYLPMPPVFFSGICYALYIFSHSYKHFTISHLLLTLPSLLLPNFFFFIPQLCAFLPYHLPYSPYCQPTLGCHATCLPLTSCLLPCLLLFYTYSCFVHVYAFICRFPIQYGWDFWEDKHLFNKTGWVLRVSLLDPFLLLRCTWDLLDRIWQAFDVGTDAVTFVTQAQDVLPLFRTLLLLVGTPARHTFVLPVIFNY